MVQLTRSATSIAIGVALSAACATFTYVVGLWALRGAVALALGVVPA